MKMNARIPTENIASADADAVVDVLDAPERQPDVNRRSGDPPQQHGLGEAHRYTSSLRAP